MTLGPSSGRSAPKSKTGCDTCKGRRIRCGEEKPSCLKCSTTGRRCSYSSTSATSARIESPQRPIAIYSSQGWRERRAFEYYFHQAGPALSGVLDVAFWRGSVLQLCRMEPAIWDAIISLSVLYERPPIHEVSAFRLVNAPAEVEHSYHHDALVWYSRSLAVVQQRIDRGVADITVSMISCILFIAIELLQGNRKAAIALCRQGTQMITSLTKSAENASSNGPSLSFLNAVVKPIFLRLDTWALIIDGDPNSRWSFDPVSLDMRLTTVEEARDVLHGIVADMKIFNIDTKRHWSNTPEGHVHDTTALVERQANIKYRLDQWYQSFTSIMPLEHHEGGTALLLMTYFGVFIEVQTCLDPDQMAYDAYEAEFAQIIHYAPTAIESTRSPTGHQPPFMFEVGPFLPLFITALKCRFPQLRRNALRFLQEAPPAQGLFMCRPAADVVAVIVALEEGLNVPNISQLLSTPGHIPDKFTRVCEFNIFSDQDPNGQQQNWVQYSLRDFDDPGHIRFIQHAVLFPVNWQG